MTREQTLEEEWNNLFYAIERHDVTLLPGFGITAVVKLLSKVAQTTFLMVSDDKSLSVWYNDRPYHDLIYHSQFPSTLSKGSIWVTYDVAFHYLSMNPRELNSVDFIVLDGIDDRTLNSDLFLALMGRVRIRTKVIIPLKSSFHCHHYKEYIEGFDYTVTNLDLIERPAVDLYYLASSLTPIKNYTEIIKTMRKILQTDTLTDMYDILILVSNRSEVAQISSLIKDAISHRDFSIITDLKGYSLEGSHRRIIILRSSRGFFNFKHRVKYIIDSGVIEVEKTDPNGLKYFDAQTTNKNKIQQHISLIQMVGSKIFILEREEEIKDFQPEILDRSLICHVLLTMRFGIKFTDLFFLTAPNSENVTNAMNQLCYMNLLRVSDDQYSFTEEAAELAKLQFSSKTERLALLVCLTHSKKFNCEDEMLKIVSMLNVVSLDTIANHIINDELDRSIVSIASDFFTILNAFNVVIGLNQRAKYKKDPFTKDIKKEIKHQFNTLHNQINAETNDQPGSEENIQRCLIMGFQFQSGSLLKSLNENGNSRAALIPIHPFHEASMEIIIKKPMPHIQEYHDGDLFIFADYSVDSNQKKSQRAFATICARIDKKIALETTRAFRKLNG
jgi:HrpA-like RNA helicase